MTPARLTSIRRAVARLGAPRLTAFLRAANQDSGGVLAVTLVDLVNPIDDAIDRGEDLGAILLYGDKYGYHLEVKKRGCDHFRIAFGCRPGAEMHRR